MTEFIGVFLGAFLAFIVGIGANEVVHRYRQKTHRRLARDLIAVELVHNLEVLHSMSVMAEQTMNEEFVASHTPISPPRRDTLQQLLGSEWLAALTTKERLSLLKVVGDLQRAENQHDAWQRVISSDQGLAPVVDQKTGQQLAYREVVTIRLSKDMGLTETNLLELLIRICNNSDKDDFTDERVQQIRLKLVPTRKGWPKHTNYGRSCRSSDARKLPADMRSELNKRYECIVVWEHDWQDCPVEVIELRTQLSEPEFTLL